jgi:hypothetical protein
MVQLKIWEKLKLCGIDNNKENKYVSTFEVLNNYWIMNYIFLN